MVDTGDLKSPGRKAVRVRVPLPVYLYYLKIRNKKMSQVYLMSPNPYNIAIHLSDELLRHNLAALLDTVETAIKKRLADPKTPPKEGPLVDQTLLTRCGQSISDMFWLRECLFSHYINFYNRFTKEAVSNGELFKRIHYLMNGCSIDLLKALGQDTVEIVPFPQIFIKSPKAFFSDWHRSGLSVTFTNNPTSKWVEGYKKFAETEDGKKQAAPTTGS